MVDFADVELFNVELFLAKNKGKAGMIEWAWACGAKPLPATECAERNVEF